MRVIVLLCWSVLAAGSVPAAELPGAPPLGRPVLESSRVPCGPERQVTAAEGLHADCGMGRHCEEGTRCCVTSETFWCCPVAARCDYDRPGECRAAN